MATPENYSTEPPSILCRPILSLSSSISIRPYRTDDAAAVAHHANNRAVWSNMTNLFPHPYTIKNADEWIEMQIDPSQMWHTTSPPWADENTKASTRIPCNYVITLSDEAIGGIGLKFCCDVETRTAEMGYWLGEEHWAKGFATIAASAFLSWTFDTFPWVVRVHAKIFSWNKASMRVVEKSGLEREAVMKAALWKEGKLGDLVVFAKIRDGLEY